MKKKALLLLAIAYLCAGCGEEAKVEELPPLVKTLVIGKDTAISEREYTGKVVSRYETPLSFQVSGEINGRYVNQGSFVNAGEVLMTLSKRDTFPGVDIAAADVAAKRAEAELAAVNLNRYKELYAANAIPKSQLDETEARADATNAALKAAEANLIKAGNANDYTKLIAPMNGVITSVTAEIGQIAAAGAPVLTIADTNNLEIEIDLPEIEYSSITTRQNAIVSFYGVDGDFPASVREITPAANAESRTYCVRLSLYSIPQNIVLGRSATVSFSQKNITYTIPLSAIDGEGDNTFCWVIENNRVHKRPIKVTIGENNTANVNLPEGLAIVAAGIHLLTENMEVRRDDVR